MSFLSGTHDVGCLTSGVVGWGSSVLILALRDHSVSAFDTINPSVPLNWLRERGGWHGVALVHLFIYNIYRHLGPLRNQTVCGYICPAA